MCSFCFFDYLCDFSQFFKELAQFDYNIYVVQLDYVNYLDFIGITGFGNYRGGCRRWDYEYFVFCNIKENSCDELDDESMKKPDAIVELDDESMKKPDAIVELDDESMKKRGEGG